MANTPSLQLKKLLRLHSGSLLAIAEPLVDYHQIQQFQQFQLQLGFDKALSNVDGKIWIMWRNELYCLVIFNNDQLITVQYQHGMVPQNFRISVVYAKCTRS